MDTAPPESPPHFTRGLSEPLLRYFEARGVLLTIEAQEALQHIMRVAIFAGVAALAAFMSWLLLTAALVSLIMDQTGWHWVKAVTMLGVAHAVLAVIFAVAMRNRLGELRLFRETLSEFRKDRAWLANPTRKL